MCIKQNIIEAVENNESIHEIAKRLCISKSCVYKNISKLNIDISNNTNIRTYNKSKYKEKNIPNIDNESKYKEFKKYAGQLISDRNAGSSFSEVCKRYDINRNTLLRYLKHYYRYESI